MDCVQYMNGNGKVFFGTSWEPGRGGDALSKQPWAKPKQLKKDIKLKDGKTLTADGKIK